MPHPVKILQLRYTHRTFCAFKPRWREFLETLPGSWRLRVEGPMYDETSSCGRCSPFPFPRLVVTSRLIRRIQAQNRRALDRSRTALCVRSSRARRWVPDADELEEEAIEMFRARQALVPSCIKRMRVELGRM